MKPEDQTERLRVAIIDDESIACRAIQRGLEQNQYEIETFGDGESFLNRMREDVFDLVLCDLRLPATDGDLDRVRELLAAERQRK